MMTKKIETNLPSNKLGEVEVNTLKSLIDTIIKDMGPSVKVMIKHEHDREELKTNYRWNTEYKTWWMNFTVEIVETDKDVNGVSLILSKTESDLMNENDKLDNKIDDLNEIIRGLREQITKLSSKSSIDITHITEKAV